MPTRQGQTCRNGHRESTGAWVSLREDSMLFLFPLRRSNPPARRSRGGLEVRPTKSGPFTGYGSRERPATPHDIVTKRAVAGRGESHEPVAISPALLYKPCYGILLRAAAGGRRRQPVRVHAVEHGAAGQGRRRSGCARSPGAALSRLL